MQAGAPTHRRSREALTRISMLSRFFIDRPIFAWVIAIITMIAGRFPS
jgi:hypothetical protein